jgi:predicted nicotinamide N-methyase
MSGVEREGAWREWRDAQDDAGGAGRTLQTPQGRVPLHEFRLAVGGREWSVLHTGALLTAEEELHFLQAPATRLPYGVALWPSSIALAHEVAARAEWLPGRSVLELGAGTGLPGIVAASLGARVSQTDRQELVLAVCQRNAERNGARVAELRLADWTAWEDDGRYDLVIGSDILYGEALHPHLRQIFERNLAPGGRVLVGDPFRGASMCFLEALEDSGWAVGVSTWSVGDEEAPRRVGVFELAPPA